MPVTRKQSKNDGCWTCKLRRKKCDEIRPTCGDCNSLGIDCGYGPKPSWMEGGEQQRQKAMLLKNDIKRNAAYKRGKANISSTASVNMATHQFDVIPDITAPNSLLATGTADSTTSVDPTLTAGSNSLNEHGPSLVTSLPWSHQQHRCSGTLVHASSIETDFIMKYFDFVFPALFPFYRPNVFETGRSWLLLLLKKSNIAYHATLGLSCYYFTMALTDMEVGAEHADCKQVRWEEVEQQTELCFESLRTDVLALDLDTSTSPTTSERVELMESITQVIIFEMAMGKAAPWNSHLPAAYTLFEEVVASSGGHSLYQGQSQSKFTSVLLGIGEPLWTNPGPSSHIWSPDQAGFRFCAGLLIFIDVIASTATHGTPKLIHRHLDILARIDDGTSNLGDAEIRLSSIVGCCNWIVRAIAQTSSLNSWRRAQVEANSSSVADLYNRAGRIATTLEANILAIQNNPKPSSSTLIWAYAAKLYFTDVVSGWSILNTEVRFLVAQIIALLQTIPPDQLRALAWPLCVAGSLALESEETSFTALFSNLGKAHTAGALEDARQIMQGVWQVRSTLDASTWSLASCFAVLGSPILLV